VGTITAAKQPYEPEVLELAGKVALVTGGTTGIGRATALLLAKKGLKVVVYGRHEQELKDALRDLEAVGGDSHGLVADQAYEDQVLRVFAETRQRFGDPEILINNAALPGGSILETSYDDAHYVLRANVLGYLACIREAVKGMRARGSGHIVNVGSMSAEVREAGSDLYVATKAAIQALSESLRKRLGPEGIRVSLVEPGSVGTNLASDQPDIGEQVAQQAAGEMLEAEDIAHAIWCVLVQPPRSNVYTLQIGPVKQPI